MYTDTCTHTDIHILTRTDIHIRTLTDMWYNITVMMLYAHITDPSTETLIYEGKKYNFYLLSLDFACTSVNFSKMKPSC